MAASVLFTKWCHNRGSRFWWRFLSEGRGQLILFDASSRCAGLVEVLLFCAVPHHSFVAYRQISFRQKTMVYLA